jgi:predicted anti-sigma-YlaC factor YlaD
MKRDRFEAWLRNIYITQDVEISCTECFDLISTFVEVELSGRDVSAELLGVKQHLDQCRACRDEYESLIDLSRIEENSELPPLQTLQDLIR